MIHMVVDRIEGPLAVVEIEKGKFRKVPVDLIGGRVRDGAVLVSDGDGYFVDEGATAARVASVSEKRRRLFER